MEFLKEIFGGGALTYEQLAAKVAEKKMKLADLSTGGYVGKEKFEALNTEKSGLETRLNEANKKLEGYDPEWKTKAEQAKAAADEQVQAVQRSFAMKEQAANLKFSSESAKRAFIADLEAKKLPIQDGKVLGFDDFVKGYRESDPGAFLTDEKPPRFSGPTSGPNPSGTKKDQANAAIRAAFGHSQT